MWVKPSNYDYDKKYLNLKIYDTYTDTYSE